MSGTRLELRSYRSAFELERRIHRIDRFRIPVPYGLPLRAVGWWFAGLVTVAVASRLPLLGAALTAVPWPGRLVLLPALLAHVACRSGEDGRPATERASHRLRRLLHGGTITAFAPAPDGSRIERLADVVLVPDERGPTLRPGVVRAGPPVVVARPVEGRRIWTGVVLESEEDRWLQHAQPVLQTRGAQVVFRCARR